MSHGFLFGLIGCLIAIGSVIVSVTTKINHISHIRSDLKGIKQDLKDIWKEINQLKKDNKEEVGRISNIEGQLKKGGS